MKETQQTVGKHANTTPPTQDEYTFNRDFAPFAAKMRSDGLPELVIHLFKHYYRQLVSGETGYISGNVAGPVKTLPAYEELDERFESYGTAALDKAVIIKLNGGLGTSMGLQGPKSLLPVKNGLSFLDITINQVLHLRKQLGARLPLVLMNSFSTDAASSEAIARYPEFQQEVATSFLQHRIPKIWKADLAPVEWSDDPDKEWCPPGHGDLYAAIDSSGMLDQLIEAGFEYAFVSNSDNLGATLDLKILGYLAIHNVPFLMEVAQRTAADRKGGHLARRPDGQFILRESAQCPPAEMEEFQDIQRYRYFNTNNLWVNLRMLREVINQRQGILGLPLIRNEKPVDPTQPSTPKVYQLETAMGSAIAVFDGAQALSVPRSRFLPVKKNSDLLGLWSDAYLLSNEYHLELAPERNGIAPLVILDDAHFGLIEEMKRRFPHGAPSLIRCNELRVEGDVVFGKGIVIEGKIHIIHRLNRPYLLENGMRLTGNQ
ncbi:MAG: UTP--glucose-1-phosphate uridylyltransferase [Caldilineaceae bacterium]